MNILETDHWCLLLPPEWSADYDDDVVRISDADEVGEIEVTTLCKDSGMVTSSEITAMAKDESSEVGIWQSSNIGQFSGLTGSFLDEDTHVQEWYVSANAVLLYITYVCDAENAGMDDAAVIELLGTLVVAD